MSVRRVSKPLAYALSLFVLGAAVALPQSLPGSANTPGGGGTSFPVSDEVFKVCDNGDSAKCFELEASGITTANTLVGTLAGTAAAPILTLTDGVIRAGGGSAAVPAFSFSNDTDTGIFRNGTVGGVDVVIDTSNNIHFNAAELLIVSGSFGMNGSNVTQASDVKWTREGAAIWQAGSDVNGAAVNQTIKAHDGITGTDISGAGLTLASGRGTGTGTAFLQLQTSPSLATGTTAQTLETRDYIHSGSKTLADNSATAFVDIGVVADDAGAVQVYYEVKAENASDQQVTSGVATVAFYNDAGTEACGAVVEAGEATAASTGTLSATITCTVSLTDEVRLNMTADSSLNVSPTLKWRIIGGTIGAVQPQ